VDLDGDSITAAGMEQIGKLKRLRKLNLGGGPDTGYTGVDVTDAELVHVEGLHGLGELSLYGRPVTDAGLRHLEGMTGLRELDLRRTYVTDAGVGRLQKTLPGVLIQW
jgi:internalin A